MADRTPLLTVSGLSVEFAAAGRTVHAVRDLSFTIGRGETVAIVGESGSGKSVTALSVMRLVEREGGRVTAGRATLHRTDGGGVDLLAADEAAMRRIRGNEISMVFQEPMTSLNPVLTIGAQIAEVLIQHQRLDRAAAAARAEELCRLVRMPDPKGRLRQYPHELSGGMRQRVMIAMALACKPALLIADEPTTALDVTVQAQILELIRALQREIGMAVLFITHDLGVVAELADRVVVMQNGERVEENDAGPLFDRQQHPYTKRLLAAVPRLGDGGGPRPMPERAAGEAPVVEVVDLVKRFPIRKGLLRRSVANVHAVEGVSFAIGRGETLALVGESGCGKSTTGRAILRLVEPTSGAVRVAGRDVTGMKGDELRAARRDMQMIFQDPYASLNPRLPVYESVAEPLAIHHGTPRAERRDRAEALLGQVGLGREHLDRYPHQFSGGQRQRLCIARALSLGPKLIVADEPVSALDVSIQAQVIDLMRDIQARLDVAYLFISHDMAVVEKMSHRVAVMYLGEIVEIGPTAAVLQDPRHPYTKTLLASVPVADPRRPRLRRALDATDVPSPIRPLGFAPTRSALVEVAPGHFVRAAA